MKSPVKAFARGVVPADQLNVGPVDLVVVLHAVLEADAEDGHGRDLGAAEVAQLAGLGHTRGQVAGQEGGLVGLEDLPLDIGDALGIPHDTLGHTERIRVGVVDDRELDIRILGGHVGQVAAKEEAGGDDQIVALAGELGQVGRVLGGLIGLNELA